MTFPVGTKKYRISSEHGTHHGIDLAVPSGTAAVATVNGTIEQARFVTRADGSPSYGNLVVIRDEAGNRHYYAHLSGFNVKPGQQVSAGHTIGWTGNTGRSTGPHLHYEIRGARGEQVDPNQFLAGDIISRPPRVSDIAPSRVGPEPLRGILRDFYNPLFDISAVRKSIEDVLPGSVDEDVLLQGALDEAALLAESDPLERI